MCRQDVVQDTSPENNSIKFGNNFNDETTIDTWENSKNNPQSVTITSPLHNQGVH